MTCVDIIYLSMYWLDWMRENLCLADLTCLGMVFLNISRHYLQTCKKFPKSEIFMADQEVLEIEPEMHVFFLLYLKYLNTR